MSQQLADNQVKRLIKNLANAFGHPIRSPFSGSPRSMAWNTKRSFSRPWTGYRWRLGSSLPTRTSWSSPTTHCGSTATASPHIWSRGSRSALRRVLPECQVAFVEWMDAGHLRHCSFVAKRDDKRPAEVSRES